ncbi:ABC transporter transmembrane domain-containing protein [Umboniibacter marinipuniceus]|uniref:ATP-binding cassette subfamily C protein/ATP-binding cassette subfamily C protein LapB n=1 Tax=Umboniibacter marinipuniceus TaxID=569599 RepID=A0A3M0A1H9_9GAMM|nr:ABC transporter transmembrane domain-containing protein [Umboniibacter marinipuniceus]RMA78476.1 ATP-binding cassette subfamily C protein/ATP-binding cassette subfamily C protein LapB [Umboniibacter marinipuniceus]
MKTTEFKPLMSQLLKELEVNSNIRNFGDRWLDEHASLSLDSTLTFLDRLDIPYEVHSVGRQLQKQECLIGVLVGDDGGVLYQLENQQLQVLLDGQYTPITPEELGAYSIALVITNPPREKPDADWLDGRLKRYRPIIPKLMILGFIANIFALSIPFITMAVYDHVIGGGAAHELPGIAVGALLLFGMMLSMRILRSQLLTTISNRVSREISESILNRLFRSSPTLLKQTPYSTLLARTSIGDRLKGLAQGTLGGALLDLPFVLMFLIAIGILGGWLVIVPIISIALYALLARQSQKQSAKMSSHTTVGGASRQTLIDEVAGKLYFMKGSNVIPHWIRRFKKANTLAARNSFAMATLQAKFTSMYYFLSIGSNLAVIALGVGLIFDGLMSPGGLIATMMLISRVTGPVNMLANSAARFPQAKQAKQQINQLIAQRVEGSYNFQHAPLPEAAPAIELDQLTIRFPNQLRPALSGVSANVEAGQLVAVTGAMGSGKSSLLEAIGGLLVAQNGFVKINGVNLSQYDPQLYRHWLGYRGEQPQMLLTSIRDFVSDGREMTDEHIEQAITLSGGGEWYSSLPDGLATQLGDITPYCLTDRMIDFEGRILAHTKLLAHDFPLYLLDIPSLNSAERQAFEEFLTRRRGNATILFTTHDNDLVKMSDQVIVLDKGAAVYAGPVPEDEPEESDAANLAPTPDNETSEAPNE